MDSHFVSVFNGIGFQFCIYKNVDPIALYGRLPDREAQPRKPHFLEVDVASRAFCVGHRQVSSVCNL
jgi:hypothetical protein